MRERPIGGICGVICAAACVLSVAQPVRAAPPEASPAAASAQAPEPDVELRIDDAIEAWQRGRWPEVRELLEPIVGGTEVGAGTIEDPFARESALRYLAEATLLDEGLDPDERRELAYAYITRLLEESPDWAPPSGLHGRPFYDLVAQARSERDAQQAEACRGQLLACEADLTELRVDYRASQDKITALQEDLASEDVFLTEVVKRNRGLALIPFGVGHFTNGNFAFGGAFLALEVVSGAAALSLLVYRNTAFGCVRTDGFNPRSLECPADLSDAEIPAREDAVEDVRSAETIMGWVFVGSLVLDLTLAQVLFKPIEIVERGKKTRSELDAEIEATEPGGPRSKERSRAPSTSSVQPSVRLRLQPHPTLVRAGAGFGLTLQF